MGYPPQGVAGGITKLSELIIDADKDWQTYGITNIAQLAAAMAKGDILVRHDNILVKLSPTVIGDILTSQGLGHLPAYMPAGGALEKWIVAWIEGSHAEGVITPDYAANLAGPLATIYSTPGPTKQPAISAIEAAATITPDDVINDTIPPDTLGCLCDAVGGAVADDGGVETDETAAANNDTVDDMTLLPAVPVVNDCYNIGYAANFGAILLKQSTIGAGVWTITWEYWNGAWVALGGVTDETGGFRQGANDSILRVSFTIPGDWALHIIQAMNLFWIRGRVSAYTSIATQPKGRQAWIERASV